MSTWRPGLREPPVVTRRARCRQRVVEVRAPHLEREAGTFDRAHASELAERHVYPGLVEPLDRLVDSVLVNQAGDIPELDPRVVAEPPIRALRLGENAALEDVEEAPLPFREPSANALEAVRFRQGHPEEPPEAGVVATELLELIEHLEREVAVFAPGARLAGQRDLERVDEHGTGPVRLDEVVHVPPLGGEVCAVAFPPRATASSATSRRARFPVAATGAGAGSPFDAETEPPCACRSTAGRPGVLLLPLRPQAQRIGAVCRSRTSWPRSRASRARRAPTSSWSSPTPRAESSVCTRTCRSISLPPSPRPSKTEYDIDTSVFKGGDTLVQRIVEERKAGFHGADVVEMGGEHLLELSDAGALQPYRSPSVANLGAGSVHADWTADRLNVSVVARNTELVPANQAPRKWEDLGTHAGMPSSSWSTTTRMVRGAHGPLDRLRQDSAEVDRLMEEIARNATFVEGTSLSPRELLAAGEFDLAISIRHTVQHDKDEGAPIDWEPSVEPLIWQPDAVGIIAEPPNPAAAMLFVDWALGYGQEVFAEAKSDPLRKDLLVAPSVKQVPFDLEGFRANQDEWLERYEQFVRLGTKGPEG